MLNSGKRWTNYGTGKLIDMAIKGASHREMAIALARTPKAIERRKYAVKQKLTRHTSFAGLMEAVVIGAGVLNGSFRIVRAEN